MTSTELENVQKLTILLTDKAQDNGDAIIMTLDLIADITDILKSVEAANGLLEARVQMLEADNARP
jgi:hypothetical protein